MANITITINLGNDDMQTGSDVAWALEQYAKIVRADFQDEQITDDADHKIKDISGNTVGEAKFTADPTFLTETIYLVRPGS